MVTKARRGASTRLFAKRAEEVEGELRIVGDPPVIIPIEDIVQPGSEWENPVPLIKKLLSSYRRTLGRHHHPLEEYRYVHAAYKMVGVGSVGTRCYIMLLIGRDQNDPLFLQIKEAQPSVLERDRKSTRLNSSHSQISYAVFCLKKKDSRLGSTGISR